MFLLFGLLLIYVAVSIGQFKRHFAGVFPCRDCSVDYKCHRIEDSNDGYDRSRERSQEGQGVLESGLIKNMNTLSPIVQESDNEDISIQPLHAPVQSCNGFPRETCANFDVETCRPHDKFYYFSKVIPASGCFNLKHWRDGGFERPAYCAKDVAIMTMTSKLTATRMVSSAKTWVAAAIQLGFRVVITAASSETVGFLQDSFSNSTVPTDINFEVLSAGESEVNDNLGFRHVLGSLKRLSIASPNSLWYCKFDDDAFVFPSNLLHSLSYLGEDPGQIVAIGNPLKKDHENKPVNFVSGGAGYCLSRPALDVLLGDEAEQDCFGGDQNVGEDIIFSSCLTKKGAKFVDAPGHMMGPPRHAFTEWIGHHWHGDPRYPVSFHWLSEEKDRGVDSKSCLACTCIEFL